MCALVAATDVVIETSRSRALRHLGCDADTVLADGRVRTWLRITGQHDPLRVAFGDEAIVSGGWSPGRAISRCPARRLPTGLLDALAVVATRSPETTSIIDITLRDSRPLRRTRR